MVAYVNGNGVRPGYVIKYNDKIYRVMTSEHRSPGKGRAFCQVKLRNLLDGLQTEIKFRADEQVERLSLEQAKMEYLYNDSSGHCFMNCETFDQVFLDEELLKETMKFLLPNTIVQIEFYNEKPLTVELPNQVTCTIETTDVALKGQTVSSSYKPAILDNGVNIQVPPFIESGDKIIVDTRTMEYIKKI